MKKTILAAVLIAAALSLQLTGCAKPGRGEEFAPKENCAYVKADGSFLWASVEKYEKGSYTEDELTAFAKEKISAYNQSVGKGTENENKEGQEILPVAFVSGKLDAGMAVLITQYDTPERLVAFAEEIGDYNVKFTQLNEGTVQDMSEALSTASMVDAKGNPVDSTQAASEEGVRVVTAEGEGVIGAEGKILYVSQGCTLKDAHTVQTGSEGTSVIVFK